MIFLLWFLGTILNTTQNLRLMDLEQLKYPIGKYQRPGTFNPEILRGFIHDIEQFPSRVVQAVGPLTPDQQLWPYRPEGWTIKQVVHHCADSHMNAFIRFKLTLTEERPTIKPYVESAWAEQVDYEIPFIHSIKIIEGLHYRWTALLKNMSFEDFQRSFYHPESQEEWSLYDTAAMYAWHSKHHLAHIQQAILRNR